MQELSRGAAPMHFMACSLARTSLHAAPSSENYPTDLSLPALQNVVELLDDLFERAAAADEPLGRLICLSRG